METRESKTVSMLIQKIEWIEVAKELDITKPTLLSWRKSGDSNKNTVIDITVNEIINKKNNRQKGRLNVS